MNRDRQPDSDEYVSFAKDLLPKIPQSLAVLRLDLYLKPRERKYLDRLHAEDIDNAVSEILTTCTQERHLVHKKTKITDVHGGAADMVLTEIIQRGRERGKIDSLYPNSQLNFERRLHAQSGETVEFTELILVGGQYWHLHSSFVVPEIGFFSANTIPENKTKYSISQISISPVIRGSKK